MIKDESQKVNIGTKNCASFCTGSLPRVQALGDGCHVAIRPMLRNESNNLEAYCQLCQTNIIDFNKILAHLILVISDKFNKVLIILICLDFKIILAFLPHVNLIL